MNDKNKSASNVPNTPAPDMNTDSDLEIQELLRKYLPEFADKDDADKSDASKSAAPEKFKAPPLSQAPEVDEDAVEEIRKLYDEEDEKPKKPGLFARLRSSHKKEEPAAPDSALFDQLSGDTDAPLSNAVMAEDEDADMKLAGASVNEVSRKSLDAHEDEVTESAEAMDEAPEVMVSAEVDAVDPDEMAPNEADSDEETADMDDTERNLLLGLGMEEQLNKKIGQGTADKMAADNDAEAKEYEQQQRRVLEYEYTEPVQTPRIAAAYTSSLTGMKIRMAIAALFTLVAFLYENLPIFGIQFGGPLDPAVYPVTYIMMSLQIMLLACAAAYEEIFTGIRNLITLQPTPESVTAVLGVYGILYSTVSAILSESGTEPRMYNFAVALCALMTLVFAYLNTKREVYSFNIVSSKKPKFVFRRIPSTAASPESEAFGALDEDNPDVLQIEHTGFVDGYFARTTEVLHSTRLYVGSMLTVITAAAVLLAIFSAVGGTGLADAVSVAYVAVLGAIPLSMFFTYSYPFFKANRDAYEMDSTIVGETSLEEYSGASIISFDDKNVFPAIGVKVQNIKIYNNNRIDRVLYYAASAFAAAGGPLGEVFDVATTEMGHSDDVTILSAGVGYLETSVDGRTIVFGRSSVLTELGADIPEEIVEEDSYIEGDLSIMYMLRDGRLIAKMFIKYVMDADFEFIVKQFANNGTCMCVKTLDPNVDEEMIFSKVKGKKYPLKVVKLHDGDARRDRVDSGIVTRGTTKGLLQVVSLCDTVISVKRSNMIISIIAAIIALTVMFIVSLSGNVGAIASWVVVVYQLFWMIPAVLTSRIYIK